MIYPRNCIYFIGPITYKSHKSNCSYETWPKLKIKTIFGVPAKSLLILRQRLAVKSGYLAYGPGHSIFSPIMLCESWSHHNAYIHPFQEHQYQIQKSHQPPDNHETRASKGFGLVAVVALPYQSPHFR
jgi:hypothetical protein